MAQPRGSVHNIDCSKLTLTRKNSFTDKDLHHLSVGFHNGITQVILKYQLG